MKWEADQFCVLKWRIFDECVHEENFPDVTMKQLMDAIDHMIRSLTSMEMDNSNDNDQDNDNYPDPVRTRTAKIVLDKSTKITQGR